MSGYNWEENEELRQKFVDTTKLKLWSENNDDRFSDAGFSEEYVFWLEALVLETIEVPQKKTYNTNNHTFEM